VAEGLAREPKSTVPNDHSSDSNGRVGIRRRCPHRAILYISQSAKVHIVRHCVSAWWSRWWSVARAKALPFMT